jgi:hypothetical protein
VLTIPPTPPKKNKKEGRRRINMSTDKARETEARLKRHCIEVGGGWDDWSEEAPAIVAAWLKKKKKRRTTKKKVERPGVKAFFETKKNFQGFGMHLCRFVDSIGEHVCVPKNYGQLSKARGLKCPNFCPSCKLQPCINVEHYDDIEEKSYEEYKGEDEAVKDGKKPTKPLALMQRMERFTPRFMTRHFGRDHVKQFGTPMCIMEATQKFHREWAETFPEGSAHI